MAVTVGFTEGGAGYAAAGDRVNIYATIPPGTVDAPKAPYTKLLLTDVEVLDVSNELSPQRGSQAATAVDGTTATTAPTGRASVSQLTLLIAVDAQQAEQAVFASEVNLLWFTVLPQDQGESTSNGVEYAEGYLETGP